jgi:ribose 5-phosphate isomerase B
LVILVKINSAGTMMPRIAIATDHAGYELKEILKEHLQAQGYEVDDFGTNSSESVDYPDYIRPGAESVASGENDLGIVLGGSGNGEAMVANKVAGIRCGLCWNEQRARLTKEHNNANVISIGARMVSPDLAKLIVDTWLGAEYQGGRHQARIEKIEG